MRIGISGLTAILIISLMASISFGLAQEESSIIGSLAANETNEAANSIDLLNNAAAVSENNKSTVMNIQGIWKFTLAGTDIIMALNQSGEILFGQAKNEADNPWNGVVVGSLSGDVFSISLAAMVGGMQVSTYMSGTVLGDSMNGSYISSDSKKLDSGKLAAIMISPDISIYMPEAIDAIPKPEQLEQETKNSTEEEADVPEVPVKKSRFKDVTDLARGIDPNIMPRMAPI